MLLEESHRFASEHGLDALDKQILSILIGIKLGAMSYIHLVILVAITASLVFASLTVSVWLWLLSAPTLLILTRVVFLKIQGFLKRR